MKFIKKIKDSSGEELTIYWQDNLVNCPALSSFLRVYAELIDKEFTNPFISWNNKNRIVWAENSERVVGGICYEFLQDSKIGWIILSFTDPDFRGRGINGLCHSIMEEDIKNLGGSRISSLVHIDNVSRQRSAEKVGLKPQFLRMNKDLK